ncbi:MAG TPA: hypothetical protein VK644_05435 [Chitinophagaceae bacterium]|nr:hypothetical protein [Chitinophagaceae bacterium]
MPDNESHQSTIALEDLYEVSNSGDLVSLSVRTGARGQKSLTTVKLNRTIKVKDVNGSIDKPLPLGSGAELAGKTLRIKTEITDISDETNDTFIDVRITGGPNEYRHKVEKTVIADNDSVLYTADIEFFTR